VPSVYLESTIPSYLAASPSRDLIVAARQQITREWWATASDRFELFVSEAVLREIWAGAPEAAERRLRLVEGLPVLMVNDDVRSLAHSYQTHLGLTERRGADAPHIAVAGYYELEYPVTWNCAHIANGHVIRRLTEFNYSLGRFTPILLTPDELLAADEGEVE
jgi:hypothetical protein